MGTGLSNRIAMILLVLSAGAGMGLLLPRALRPRDQGRPTAPAPPPGRVAELTEPNDAALMPIGGAMPLGEPLTLPSRRGVRGKSRPPGTYGAEEVRCTEGTLSVSRNRQSPDRLEFTLGDVSHVEADSHGLRHLVLRSGDRVVVSDELTSLAPPALQKRLTYVREDG